MTTAIPGVEAPEHVFAGERIELQAHYQPAGEPVTILFQLQTANGKVFEAAKIDATTSPAVFPWTVALPPGTKHPTEILFTATVVGLPDSKASRTVKVHKSINLSIWAAHALAIKGDIEKLIDQTMIPELGFSEIDEISSMTGIRNRAQDPLTVEWDTRVPNGLGGDNTARRKRFREILDYAHARFIKVLVGFEAVDTGKTPSTESQLFMQFVRAAVEKNGSNEVLVDNDRGEKVCVPRVDVITKFGNRIIDQMFGSTHGLPWDGISFDLEIGQLGPRYRPVIRTLFHHLHDHPQMAGKRLAYATFGFTDYLKGRNGAPASHAFQKVQTFEMASGKERMIARPMLYEEPITEAHLKAVIDYANKPKSQGGAGLQRHQLQLGLQGDLQPGQAPRPDKITDNSEVIPLITNLLRPEATGLIYFMLMGSKKTDTARMKFFADIRRAYAEGA